MLKRKYDFAFGLGNACSCTQTLRGANLQFLSFPFDWIAINRPADIRFRADTICNEFADWFNRDDFVYAGTTDWHTKDFYRNTRTDIVFNHDFPKGVPFEESFPAAEARYQRRIARLLACLRSSKKVLLVRLDRPDQEHLTTAEDCLYVRNKLSAKFPGVDFDMLLYTCRSDVSFERRLETQPYPWLLHVEFDYKDHSPEAQPYSPNLRLTRQIARRFKVTDYRTPAEIRAGKEKARAKKKKSQLARYARCGANNFWQYALIRVGNAIRRVLAFPLLAIARCRARRFDQIVPLGKNCEVAFRFFCRWKFVDSSLFAWAQVFDLSRLTGTLRRIDTLFEGEMTIDKPTMMWKCENSGIYIHGNLKAPPRGLPPPCDEAIAADKVSTQARVKHLKEKFQNYVTNGKSTLFIHSLSREDECASDLDRRLSALETALSDLGAENWRVLYVCERKYLHRMPQAARRTFRAVRLFNPTDQVTNCRAGDAIGWNLIFTEFGPRVRLPKKHKFKFE